MTEDAAQRSLEALRAAGAAGHIDWSVFDEVMFQEARASVSLDRDREQTYVLEGAVFIGPERGDEMTNFSRTEDKEHPRPPAEHPLDWLGWQLRIHTRRGVREGRLIAYSSTRDGVPIALRLSVINTHGDEQLIPGDEVLVAWTSVEEVEVL